MIKRGRDSLIMTANRSRMIQPSVFYGWHRQLMDNLPAAVEFLGGRKKQSREAELERRIAALEAKLAKKDNVIAEISEEYVALKKEIGEP